MTTTAILVGLGAIMLIVYAISPGSASNLVFFPELVRAGEVWRLVTWPIVSVPSFWVLISMFFFWYFGHIVEEMVGRIRFTRLILAIVVAPPLFVSIVDLPTAPEAGLNLLGSIMLVLFAAENPNAPFFFNIPAWIIAAIFIGIDVLGYVGNRWWGTLVVLLLAVGIALVTIRQWGFAERLDMIPRFSGSSRHRKPTRSASGRARRATPRRTDRSGRTEVIKGPWAPPAVDGAARESMQAELDGLLDKISAQGLEALSSDEKKRLNELSKLLR